MINADPAVDFYDAQYEQLASQLFNEVRKETFGDDIGQSGWLTQDEHDLFLSWMALEPKHKLLDIACGSGGTTLRIAQVTGCSVHGVDIHEQGIATAQARAGAEGLGKRATFEQLDASQPMHFPNASFDAIICIDAIIHLPNREKVLEEFARVLRPGGHLMYTDTSVITGPMTNEEIAIRSSIGFFLFVPVGTNERMLMEGGFDVLEAVDRSENMAQVARRWQKAREARATDLRKVEGNDTFDGQQRFLDVTARVASEKRLSRIAFHARRR